MEFREPRTLGAMDYLVVGAMLFCSTAIGLYHAHKGRKKNQGSEGYLLGNRSISFLPVALSIAVNYKSSVSIIGAPAEVYKFGIIYGWGIMALILAAPIVGYSIVPILYKLKISSAYEYMDKRYGRPIRLLATSGFLLQTMLYMGINVYGPSLALSRVSGFPQVVSMVVAGSVCLIYTTLGGLRGVIWTDVFQAAVIVIAMTSFVIRGTVVAGGAATVWNHMLTGGRSNLVTFDPDPRIRYTFWTTFIGYSVMWIGTFGTTQTNIQRYLSVNSVKKARWAMFIGMAGVAIMSTLAMACGVVLYSLFHSCDPIHAGCITTRDELMPFAVMDIFRSYPGMRGLFLAGVFSASLSTVSSGLNAMVSVVVSDFLKPYTSWNDSRYVRMSRALTICFGLVTIGIGFMVSVLGEIVTIAFGLVGSFSGAYTAVFIMGIWMPFVNSWGAAAGLLCGSIGTLASFLGSRSFKKSPDLLRQLPVSTTLCPAQCGYMDSINSTMTTSDDSFNFTSGASVASTSVDYEMSPLQSYLSLSAFLFPAIALLYALVVGIIVSLLSGGWKNRHLVDKSTIHPMLTADKTKSDDECKMKDNTGDKIITPEDSVPLNSLHFEKNTA